MPATKREPQEEARAALKNGVAESRSSSPPGARILHRVAEELVWAGHTGIPAQLAGGNVLQSALLSISADLRDLSRDGLRGPAAFHRENQTRPGPAGIEFNVGPPPVRLSLP